MAATKLTAQDRKDFEKFTKYLVYKCIQIIVQSRLGERVKTQSRPFSTGSDWFNLAIKDLPEVLSECKKVVTTGTLSVGHNVCLEISLKTTDGETMILETWWLNVNDETDPAARISYSVYNRMGVLLKSLFCATRATPAYRLSRKQGPDTYVVCYRIYNSEPEMLCLGEAYKVAKVGAVPSPFGTVLLSVAYRTKMLISPHSSLKDFAADLKDDHFKVEGSPKKTIDIPKPCYVISKETRPQTSDDGYTFGESEYCATSFSTSPPFGDGLYLCQSPSERGVYHRTSAENLVQVQKSTADNFAHQIYSETAIKSSGPNLVRVRENGINGKHHAMHQEESEDELLSVDLTDKNHLSVNLKQIGAFVSDGESDSGDDVDGKVVKNTTASPKHNTDSVELPFVKMVREMSNMDTVNANNQQHQGAVINATNIINGHNYEKSNQNHITIDMSKEPHHNLSNGGFIAPNKTAIPSSYSGCGNTKSSRVDNSFSSPNKKGKGNLSELSQRLRRVSGESNQSSDGCSSHGGTDEYVMVDVKNALTELDDNPELGQFYRECKLPPDLAMFRESSHNNITEELQGGTMQDMFNSITDQLQQFEMQAQDFDEFVNSLSVGESS